MPKTKEQCEEIREKMRSTILQKSALYFARNGFAGTKISDLAKNIGIASGTIYLYFDSKEDLFQEILDQINYSEDLKKMALLVKFPVSAKEKMRIMSKFILDSISSDNMYAAKIALNTQVFLENSICSQDTSYKSDLYKYTADIIIQGQKEGSMVNAPATRLADFYWSVVYVYAMKKLFTTGYDLITSDDLCRIVMIVGSKN